MADLTKTRYTHPIRLGSLDALEVRHPDFQARLALQGAHLVHFAPHGEGNWLWMSPTARFEAGVAIRGGIPVCWPWFGDPARNSPAVKEQVTTDGAHGFARKAQWQLASVRESDNEVALTLTLDCSNKAHQWPWNGQARANLTFYFRRNRLSLSLLTQNDGSTPLAISQALHTYLPTGDISAARIEGFDACQYLDTLDGWTRLTQAGTVTFEGETDRIYQAAPELDIHTPPHTYRLAASGSDSTVVWNPGPEKARRLSDFPDDSWTDMLCVETANAADDARHVAPGNRHTLAMILTRI